MTDRWLSVEEIVEYLGVSQNTIYARIDERNTPDHRIGRLWKFKSEEIDECARSGRVSENEGTRKGMKDLASAGFNRLMQRSKRKREN
jgi:excisionase family DNA binding protein